MVRKRVISTGVTLGLIGVGLFLLSRFNVGDRLIESAGGAGAFFPNIFRSFIGGGAEATGGLQEQAVKIGENLQRALGGGLLLSEQEALGGGGFPGGTVTEENVITPPGGDLPNFLQNAFKAFKPKIPDTNERPPSRIFNVQTAFTPQAQTRRIVTQESINAEESNQRLSQPFGGFGSAIQQESALQREIAKTRANFPQFFKVNVDTGPPPQRETTSTRSGEFIQQLDRFGRPIRSL